MDSYTDVSGQNCGCGCARGSCNTSAKNNCSPCWQQNHHDMNAFPWASNDGCSAPSYSYEGSMYPDMSYMDCVSTEPGCLEQQFPVAMAYVPWQQWQTTYAPERALVQGTIFPELDLQFNYGRCSR